MNITAEELKQRFDIVEYIGRDIKLTKNGKGHMGLCPFHDDKNPSFSVLPDKQTFKCFGCSESGDIFSYIQKRDGLDFKGSFERLKDVAGIASGGNTTVKSRVPQQVKTAPLKISKSSNSVNGVKESKALEKVVKYYHKQLLKNDTALAYLESRGLKDVALIKAFKIGYCDGSLINKISPNSEEYELLSKCGILKKNKSDQSTYEHFNGYIVAPFFSSSNIAGEIYGRAVNKNSKIIHKYLPGSHVGIFNPKAIKVYDEIFLCECVIDALSLFAMGLVNVTCSFGKGTITNEIIDFMAEHTKKVVICFDNDGEQDDSAESMAIKLGKVGISSARVILPKSIKDINEMLVKEKSSGKSVNEIKELFLSFEQRDYDLVEKLPIEEDDNPKELTLIKDEYGIMLFRKEDRVFIIKKLKRDTLLNLKLTLKVTANELSYLGAVNLENTREKEFFSRRAKDRIGTEISEYDLLADLEELTWYLEAFQEEEFIKNQKEADAFMNIKHAITPEESESAVKLLQEKDYLTEVFLRDMEYMGLKGERNNKLLYMICAISRLDMYPAHILVVAPYGSGKSELQKSVLMLLPKKDVFRLSRSTEQVLYYLDEDGLNKKVISLDEIDGAGENKYSFRTLMSERRLEILFTDKNEMGQLKAKHKIVNGQASVFLATTDPEKLDEETKSRMLIVYGDDSREQTKNIMESQFLSDNTEKGGEMREIKADVIKKHQDIHSMIDPIAVYFPMKLKKKILNMDERLIARRNFRSYGTIVRSIAMSRQYRREILTKKNGTKYIMVKEEDIALANELLTPVFNDQQADLKGPLKDFYHKIIAYVDSERGNLRRTEVDFTAREIRERTHLAYTQTYNYLLKLIRMEYLVRVRGKNGQTNQYRLYDEK